MSNLGQELIDALEDGKKYGLVRLEPSPNVADLRKKLNLSQMKFAAAYHINPETLKKWEQHKREPDSISKAYLKCIAKNPELIMQLVNS